MRSRAYARVVVNQVDVEQVTRGRDGVDLMVGVDVGKFHCLATGRWADARFERPWKIDNPDAIAAFVVRLRRLKEGRKLVVAMEPSGTYGDALRQALHDAGIPVVRISPKAAHDYAEIFDGAPSQHDGKDAAVIAELAAIGKGSPWVYEPRSAWEQELSYWVDVMENRQRSRTVELGHLEALLARHWPEATRLLDVSSGTLLRVLEKYGGPAALAADPGAARQLKRWGGPFLHPDKQAALLASAAATMGVRQGDWDCRRMRDHATRARAAQAEVVAARRRLKVLAKGHNVLEAQAKAVGVATACVLWDALGDPRDYSCGRAYRKAMGLNLAERSSGIYQGQLKISKRGQPRTRQWLYLASLRLIRQSGVSRWYQAKKARDGNGAKRAVVAVMRKLALALYRVGAKGDAFEAARLFRGVIARTPKPPASGAACGEAEAGIHAGVSAHP